MTEGEAFFNPYCEKCGLATNHGLGQEITRTESYRPESFSVVIPPTTRRFRNWNSTSGLGTYVPVVLELRLWDTSGNLFGSSSKSVEAEYSGTVEFIIADVQLIPADTTILYAVYVADALDDEGPPITGIQGNLYWTDAGTGAVRPTAGTKDVGDAAAPIDSRDQWTESFSRRLSYSLTGFVVD
jgi:hypothetical protein